MRKLGVLLAALSIAGCASLPTPQKKALIIVGTVLGAAVVAKAATNDDDPAPARPVCHYVIGPNGSTQVCN